MELWWKEKGNPMKISEEDFKRIENLSVREAQKHSSAKGFEIYVGARYNVNDKGYQPHFNIALITKDFPHFGDTDLYDNSFLFERNLASKIEANKAGEVLLDLWIYEKEPWHQKDHGDLVCNTQAFFVKDRLVKVTADIDTLWIKENL